MLLSARQVVLAVPGVRGAKVMIVPAATAAASMVPVIELHAWFDGAGKPAKLLVTATMAWFM